MTDVATSSARGGNVETVVASAPPAAIVDGGGGSLPLGFIFVSALQSVNPVFGNRFFRGVAQGMFAVDA